MTKRITSILLALLLSATVLASCGNGGENESTNESTNDTTVSDTSAPEETENTEDTSAEEDTSTEDTSAEDEGVAPPVEGEVSADPVTSVTNVDEAMAFIQNNVYSQVPDYIPMMMMMLELDLADADSISHHTGLTDTTGINNIILSQSGVGSFAYSLLYLRTDGSNTADIQKKLGESVDPAKWICVSAEKIASIQLDNDVLLVMGMADQVDAIMGAVTSAASGVFTNVGDVVAVMG